jgi:alkyl sulfatase BDS1-like metallo-beta-lactamase superfamily hydrolase
MNRSKICLTFCTAVMLIACNTGDRKTNAPSSDLGATGITADLNRQVAAELPLSDQEDFEQARRGLIAQDPNLTITADDGTVLFDQQAYGFLAGDAPATVNPSLWRQEQLNSLHGLFKVSEGIYQLRGFDTANMTIIEGKTGWIIVDPLTAKETAARAIAFARRHLVDKPIKAILFTHSHIDHFGGSTALMSPAEALRDGVRIIAPDGFMEEAVSENVMAGPVMVRRSIYMYGDSLIKSAEGQVGSGLGKGPAIGTAGILRPTELIRGVEEEKVIDGVRFVFFTVSGSEAPAEFVFYLPEQKVFCGAEIVSRNMHNLYTLRGAKVRDALKWSRYIDDIIQRFGESEIYFGCHHWPIWGQEKIIRFLKQQRDIYKYIHDQTLRLAYRGMTPREIAEEMDYPASLRQVFANRGYYGTLSHNAKAVYQFYFGWFDGNPANLNPLPPEASAKKYVDYMGGAEQVLKRARESFDKGEYRWTAEVLNHLVFADPDNTAARQLLAQTYRQLGYQAESGPWRNIYLTGARELIHGKPQKTVSMGSMLELLTETPISLFLDAMAARLDGPKADGMEMTINLHFTDLNEDYVLILENSVLHHRKTAPAPDANAAIRLTKKLYLQMAIGQAGIVDLITSDDISFSGSKLDLIRFFSLFDQPKVDFNIIDP